MPDFEDVYSAAEIVVLGNNDLAWGTAAIGDDYGVCVSCTVTRDADIAQIAAANGNLKAVVMTNPKFEAVLETIFSTGVTPPGMGEAIELPYAGVTGRVTSAEITWTQGKERGLRINVTSWDALETAVLYKLNTSTGTFTSLDA